ncbi:fatty-acyl-CoA synthase [Marmoricola endophyticus]|uniref:Fatty-acyl-CoA synthase n=1 Tax=Marmoricola endophyticus TaxID=2040280 RepID=A0A917BU09_9ACTN|nr:AMP-binding protein [Marmoricola endophyticus]GGF58688.1 fatty-acyl-CoA synthase [Marmoricola endophyticus]
MPDKLSQLAQQAVAPAVSLKVLTQAGVVRPHSPLALAKVLRSLQQWGMGIAGGFGSTAARFPDRVAIVDELGELTYAEVAERGNAVADSLAKMGVSEGDSVAVLVRNHRGFLDAAMGIARLGADALYLNTAFAAPQLGEVCEREKPAVIIHDQEFDALIDKAGVSQQRVLAWVDDPGEGAGDRTTLEAMIEDGDPGPRTPPSSPGRSVILTSGTTGTPKGAPRGAGNLGAAVALLSRIPLRSGWRCHIAAPLFHTWGWAHLQLAMLLGTTCVLRRTFDPEQFLRTLDDERCDSAAVIPVMLQRSMRLPEATRDSVDLSRLKVVAVSGSALPGDLATEWMDQFGDNIYNTYGSTEVAWASIATPEDLRSAPGTAGRPPVNTVVRLFDEDDHEVPEGEAGRIFVGNSMLFEGYTGGGTKDSIDGLMSSGDIGRFDEDGRLFIEGRDDEMIVSGGENVFPQEVEDVIAKHDGVDEVAAIGVDDDEFGQRLRAFVVRSDDSLSEDDVKDHVKQNLARYKVPRDVVFLDELPRNATGKILKRELKDDDEDGTTEGDGD